MQQRLSIVIPSYNRKEKLKKSLQGCFEQLSFQDQIIVVDDGSTDKTWEYLKKTKPGHKNLTIIKHKANKGFLQARNTGVKIATGDWVCLLDSDDYYLPGAITQIKKYLHDLVGEIDVVQFMLRSNVKKDGSYKRGFRPTDKWQTYTPSYSDVVTKTDLKGDMHRCIRTQVFKHNLYSENNPGYETYFYAKLAQKGIKSIYINQEVVQIDEKNTSRHSVNKHKKWPKEFATIYQQFIKGHASVFKTHPDQDYIIRGALLQSQWFSRDIGLIFTLLKIAQNHPDRFINRLIFRLLPQRTVRPTRLLCF